MEKEEIREKLEELKGTAVAADSFAEAMKSGKPWLFRRHKKVILTSEQINEKLGCPPYRMNAEVVAVLWKMEGRRGVQGVYENGKRVGLVSVWSLPL